MRDIVWGRATHIIWLNYPFYTVFWRAIGRTLTRVFRKEELFSGNRETFRIAFLSKESILWWVLTTFHSRQREYRALFTGRMYPQLKFIEIRNPQEEAVLIDRMNVSPESQKEAEINLNNK